MGVILLIGIVLLFSGCQKDITSSIAPSSEVLPEQSEPEQSELEQSEPEQSEPEQSEPEQKEQDYIGQLLAIADELYTVEKKSEARAVYCLAETKINSTLKKPALLTENVKEIVVSVRAIDDMSEYAETVEKLIAVTAATPDIKEIGW